MGKNRQKYFHLKKGETLIKKGMMDYCVTGGYGHAAMGDAWLTDRRFYFAADVRRTGHQLVVEIPLNEINEVTKTGVPVLTRSILVVADGRPYRFNVFPMGGWIRAITRAAESYRAQAQMPQDGQKN